MKRLGTAMVIVCRPHSSMGTWYVRGTQDTRVHLVRANICRSMHKLGSSTVAALVGGRGRDPQVAMWAIHSCDDVWVLMQPSGCIKVRGGQSTYSPRHSLYDTAVR
jgi:hypothetical protein